MRHSEDTVALLFGGLIQKARRKLKWSVTDTASLAGISRGYLHDLEIGRKAPSLYVAARLMYALDLDLYQVAETIDLHNTLNLFHNPGSQS